MNGLPSRVGRNGSPVASDWPEYSLGRCIAIGTEIRRTSRDPRRRSAHRKRREGLERAARASLIMVLRSRAKRRRDHGHDERNHRGRESAHRSTVPRHRLHA